MSDDESSPPTPITPPSEDDTLKSTATPSEEDVPKSPIPANEDDAPGSDRSLPESDVNIAFGPQNWYWARYGEKWRFVRSESSDWSNLGIYEAYWVAFKHNTGFIIGGVDEDGEARVVHSWNDGYMVRADEAEAFVKSREAYINLRAWLSNQVNFDPKILKDVFLSIGPKGSYFARCGTKHITHALPTDLETAIKESDSPPITIALGVKGAWVVLWADGSRSWSLRHAYYGLVSTGKLGSKENKAVFVALNPYVEDEYFVVTENGECTYNASFSNEKEGVTFYEMTEEYMQMRAKRDGSSFSYPMKKNGVERKVEITPEGRVLTGGSGMLWRARQSVVRRDVLICSAVAGGTGALAKVLGMPVMKAVKLGVAAGGGAAAGMWFRG